MLNRSLVLTVLAALAVCVAVFAGCETSAGTTTAPSGVVSITISPAPDTLQIGASRQLAANVMTASGAAAPAVTWQTSDTAVALVSEVGMVWAVRAGSAFVRATAGGMTDSTAVVVLPANAPPPPAASVASVTVAPHSDSLQVGDTVRLNATLKDSAGHVMSGPAVSWSTSNSSAATVTSTGLVTAVAVGSARIKATSQSKSDSAAVTVAAPPPPPPPPSSAINHVAVVVLENHDYSSVIGSSSMPYLNGLAQQYGLATQYYADTHPSIGNYFMLTVGDTITNNDGWTGTVTEDNLFRELIKAGKSWKSYAEDMPSVGYTGSYYNNYARYHNPPALISDVVNDANQVKNLVPFTQLATDLANNTLPNFSLIIPNVCSDAHNCSLGTADSWLQTNIDPLIKNATFQQDGLLIITFDEAASSSTNGGGKIAWVVIGPKTKRGYQSSTLYQHESTLRFILKSLGVTVFPNHAASAKDMGEFLTP